jgi:hypothetical protein
MAVLGTFAELIAGSDASNKKTARELRSLILDVHPGAVEVVRLGDRAATYGLGPKKMIEGYCYIMPQRGYVNLGFYKGAKLRDPDGLLEGTGAAMRHVKVTDLGKSNRAALRRLVADALAERSKALT